MQIVESYDRVLPEHEYPSETIGHSPRIEIHYVERQVHGNGIGIKVWGEMKIAAKEWVYAHELKLNTLQVLQLTAEPKIHFGGGIIANKTIFHKGEYGNYASIDVYKDDGTQLEAGHDNLAHTDGSIWLNFVALGE